MGGLTPKISGCCFALFTAHVACERVGQFEDFERAKPDAGVPHRCDPLPGKKVDAAGLGPMVLIKAKQKRCFWIDETEVQVPHYAKFVAQNPAFSAWDPKRCAWKSTPSKPHVEPGDLCAQQAAATDGEWAGANKPIRCVDWCDARAFCQWAGKDLCFDGTASVVFEPAGAPPDWTTACGPNTPLPYGKELQPGVCNIGLSEEYCFFQLESKCRATAVGTFGGCSYPGGPLDMIGNVSEWVFRCQVATEAGPGTLCLQRGGSYAEPNDWTCTRDTGAALQSDARRPDLGFRCCAELTAQESASLD